MSIAPGGVLDGIARRQARMEIVMDWEEARPKADAVVVGETLERLSVGELEARIVILQREIERVRAELEKKRAHEARASELFKR